MRRLADHDTRVDPPEPVDRDGEHLAAAVEVPAGAGQDGRVLDGGVHQALHRWAPRGERPQHRRVHGRGVRAGEGDLLGAGPEGSGDGLACPVEQHPGGASLAVQALGVGPAVVERGEQRLPARRVQRRDLRGVPVRARAGGPGRAARAAPVVVRLQVLAPVRHAGTVARPHPVLALRAR